MFLLFKIMYDDIFGKVNEDVTCVEIIVQSDSLAVFHPDPNLRKFSFPVIDRYEIRDGD